MYAYCKVSIHTCLSLYSFLKLFIFNDGFALKPPSYPFSLISNLIGLYVRTCFEFLQDALSCLSVSFFNVFALFLACRLFFSRSSVFSLAFDNQKTSDLSGPWYLWNLEVSVEVKWGEILLSVFVLALPRFIYIQRFTRDENMNGGNVTSNNERFQLRKTGLPMVFYSEILQF